MEKLPVSKVLVFAFMFPIQHFQQFLRMIRLPIIYSGVWLAIWYLFGDGLGDDRFGDIGHFIIFPLMALLFIVSWHRLVLLGEEAVRRTYFPMVEKRDLIFIGYAVLCIALPIGGMTVFSIFTALIFSSSVINEAIIFGSLFIILGLICFFFCHWFLIFPAVA
ncbi:MAG: hypothetical protein CMM52_12230 [Rhodospirillaceae bacterium]|nr:hypothetical protein [Rhodospirillaceae bacterium]